MIPMQSDTIKEVTKALIAANGSFDECVKESDGHNYKYAKLPQLLKAVLPSLRKHGLMLQNIPQMIEGNFMLICQITHAESGEFIRGVYPLERDESARGMTILQKNGSAITYAAKYCIANMLSLPVLDEEDNDGANKSDGKTISKDTAKKLHDLYEDRSDLKSIICKNLKIDSLDDLYEHEVNQVIKFYKDQTGVK